MVGRNGIVGGISGGGWTMVASNRNLPRRPGQSGVKRVVCAQVQEMGMRCEAESLYDVLGISSGATYRDIKSSYRRLARLFHPDAAKFSCAAEKHKSAQHFIEIRNAYSTLSDPQSRARYDRRRLASTVGRFSSRVSCSRQFVGRNWETDQCW